MQSMPSVVKNPSMLPPFHSLWTSDHECPTSFVARLVKWNGATVPSRPVGLRVAGRDAVAPHERREPVVVVERVITGWG